MTEKTCMNCGTVSCDHKDARRCANGRSLWTPAEQQDESKPSAKDWEEAVVSACMKVESCYVANDPKQTLLNLEQYWFDIGVSEQATMEETALILDLRQRLSEKECQRVNWMMQCKRQGDNAQILINELRQQLAEKDAEIARLKTVPMKYRRMAFNAQLQDENRELEKQLAASQLREQQYRALVESAFRDGFRSPETYNDTVLNSEDDAWCNSEAFATIAAQTDTTALEAMIAKAGEVMRERVLKVAGWANTDGVEAGFRALPGVTLEDLRK